MRRPDPDTVQKAAFVLGVAVLAFLYGYAVRGFGWFPSSLLEDAYEQARAVRGALSPGRDPGFVVPRRYDRAGARTLEPDSVQPGLTLVVSHWEEIDWDPGVRLIDREGRTVHQWHVEPTQLFPDAYGLLGPGRVNVHGTHLFPDGDLVVNVQGAGTARLDACGGVVWKVAGHGHHSIARADDGSFWIPGRRPGTGDEGSDEPDVLPGEDGSVSSVPVIRVGNDGEVLEEINVFDVVARELPRHIIKEYGLELRFGDPVPGDFAHLNDVEPLSGEMAGEYPLFEAGDLLVSLRNLDLVFVFDPETGRVKWHASEPFIQQHDPDFMGAGWIGVFDNNRDYTPNRRRLGGSRVVGLQPHTDSTRVLYSSASGETFYTRAMGKWQQLPNGNLLLTESQRGRAIEVTADGRLAWEWSVEPYDDSSVPEVSEATRYALDREQVSSWPCSPGAD